MGVWVDGWMDGWMDLLSAAQAGRKEGRKGRFTIVAIGGFLNGRKGDADDVE